MIRMIEASLVACVLSATACGEVEGPDDSIPPSTEDSPPTDRAGRDLELRFTTTDPIGTILPPGTMFTNTGTAPELTAISLYANRGAFTVSRGFGAGDTSIRTPAHFTDPMEPPKSAVVSVTNTGADDRLDPGTGDFSFGADFVLNTMSSTPGSDSNDDGDNLIQRGLAASATQYKIQIDAGKPSCVLRQGATMISAKASQAVERSMWYHVTCQRVTSAGTTTLTLTVTHISTGASIPTTPGTGPAIDLSLATAVPLSIGGKLSDSGDVILNKTDQFNGQFDNVFLDVP